jgi:cytochrome c oxidase subunit 2
LIGPARATAVGALGVLTSACDGIQDMLAPAGPAAHRIASLGWFVLITFSVVTVVMWVIVFWLAYRRRGTLDSHQPIDAPEDRRWILIGGFTIPIIVLGTIFVVMLKSMSAFPMGNHDMAPSPPTVRLTGHQWWWEVEYLDGDVHGHVTDANEIHIPAGRPIDIELRSHDVIHSFWVPRLHGKVDLIPDLVNRIRIQADQPGVYRGECAEYCGPQHAHMVFYVVAHTADDFQRWLARSREPGSVPADAFAQHGQQVFMTAACVLCHTIRGTDARGRVGPDLTHVGSRLGIAANTAPNDVASLEAWVTHAQSLKPSAQMPNITALDGEDLRALVAYLRQLK